MKLVAAFAVAMNSAATGRRESAGIVTPVGEEDEGRTREEGGWRTFLWNYSDSGVGCDQGSIG